MGNSISSIVRSLAMLLLALVLSACAEKQSEQAGASGEYDSNYSPEQSATLRQKSKYMAYEHRLSIELKESLIASTHTEIVALCEVDTKYSCVVLSSNLLSGDEYQSSKISLRVKSEGVAYFSKIAGQGGKVSSQSTQSQDLSDSIQDNAKRTEMATNYRNKLLVLEAKETDDIDSMLKIASELSKVQSQLEFAQGERAKLFQKVETQLLNIDISSPSLSGFWKPIGNSLKLFGDDLAYAIADVISSSAAIIPWFIFFIILFLFARVIFRLLRTKK